MQLRKEGEQALEIFIPKEVTGLLEALENKGYEAWVVGGCVRDSLLGREPQDWDVTTSALPREVCRALSGYTVLQTGLKHGTVTAITPIGPVEVTTYRVDGVYTDGRHPDAVRFTASLREDLSRRDFTINAMAYHPQRGLFDAFGGQEDLRQKRVRCVGEPAKRFGEDALRLLRALRFASVLGFSLEENTARAVRENRALLQKIAMERVSHEFVRLLCGRDADRVLRAYIEVIGQFLPELLPLVGCEQHNPHHVFDVFEHTLHSLPYVKRQPVMRLTMLLHDVAKPNCFSLDDRGVGHFYGHAVQGAEMAREILTRLRLDKATIERVFTLIRLHDVQIEPTEKSVKHWLNKLGEETFRQLLRVKAADNLAQRPDLSCRVEQLRQLEDKIDEILRERQCFSLKDLAVNGHDLIALGMPPGKGLGEALGRLLEEVMDGACPNEKEALLERAKALLAQGQS